MSKQHKPARAGIDARIAQCKTELTTAENARDHHGSHGDLVTMAQYSMKIASLHREIAQLEEELERGGFAPYDSKKAEKERAQEKKENQRDDQDMEFGF